MLRSWRFIRHFTDMKRKPRKDPLIAIIGATGTGKSQVLQPILIHTLGLLTTAGS
jgi:ABC-type lipoprotein export system ATPase subunit